MKLVTHSQTSVVKPLKFRNWYVFSPHNLLGLLSLIRVGTRVCSRNTIEALLNIFLWEPWESMIDLIPKHFIIWRLSAILKLDYYQTYQTIHITWGWHANRASQANLFTYVSWWPLLELLQRYPIISLKFYAARTEGEQLVHVMVWCRQATSHQRNLCWVNFL